MNLLANAQKRAAGSMDASIGHLRYATITSFDPNTVTVKVLVQPDGTPSGWIPLGAAGLGSGAAIIGPNIGDQVIVGAMEGAGEHYVVVARIFDALNLPPISPGTTQHVQAGEVAFFGPSGSYLHMSGGNIYAACGTFALNGKLVATGDVVAGPNSVSLIHHQNTAVTPGTALSGPPA